MSTETLTEFLLARIAEAEIEAHTAYADLTWANDEGEVGTGWATGLGYEHNHLSDPASVMTRRWSPERVLAGSKRDRRIVELHTPDHECTDGSDSYPGVMGAGMHEPYCPTLRILALPYADHPDYRDEWRP